MIVDITLGDVMKSSDRILLIISLVAGILSVGIFLKLLFVASDILKESIEKCSFLIDNFDQE